MNEQTALCVWLCVLTFSCGIAMLGLTQCTEVETRSNAWRECVKAHQPADCGRQP